MEKTECLKHALMQAVRFLRLFEDPWVDIKRVDLRVYPDGGVPITVTYTAGKEEEENAE